jgi:hypothetical protein
MARIPDSYVPRVDAQPMQATQVRGDGQVWQPPDMATERIQQLGQTLSQSGGMLMRVGEAIQSRRDDTMVMRNDARLGEAKLKITDGYRRTVGVAAEEQFESTLKSFDEEARKTASTLENDTQRQLFAMRADSHRLDLMSDAMTHRERQSIAAKVGAAEALAAQRGQEYVVAVESMDAKRAATAKLTAVDTLSKQWTTLRGDGSNKGPEWEAYKRANLSKLHAAAVNRLIAIDQPDAALSYLKGIPSDELEDAERTDLLEWGTKRSNQNSGVEFARQAMDSELEAVQKESRDGGASPAVAHARYKQALLDVENVVSAQAAEAVDEKTLPSGAAEHAREAAKTAAKMERERVAALEVGAVDAAKTMLYEARRAGNYGSPQQVLSPELVGRLEQVGKLVEVNEWWGNGHSIVVNPEKVLQVREILADPNKLLAIVPSEIDSEYGGSIPPMLRAELVAKWRRRNEVALDAVDTMFVKAEDLTNEFVSQVYGGSVVSPEMKRLVEERLQAYVTEAAKSGATVPTTTAQKKELFAQLIRDVVFVDDAFWDSTPRSFMMTEEQRRNSYVQPSGYFNEDGSKKLFYFRDISGDTRQAIIDSFVQEQRGRGAQYPVAGRNARMPSETEIAERYIQMQRMVNPNYGKAKNQ